MEGRGQPGYRDVTATWWTGYVVMSKTQDFEEWEPITLESLCSVFGKVNVIGNKVVGYGFLNQTDYILWCLKNDPSSRRIVASMFLPEMNALKPLEECAFQINLSVKNGELYMTLYQRSLDIVTANFWNVGSVCRPHDDVRP